MNNLLYGSAGSKEGIVSVIESFWYRKDVTLDSGAIFKYNYCIIKNRRKNA